MNDRAHSTLSSILFIAVVWAIGSLAVYIHDGPNDLPNDPVGAAVLAGIIIVLSVIMVNFVSLRKVESDPRSSQQSGDPDE